MVNAKMTKNRNAARTSAVALSLMAFILPACSTNMANNNNTTIEEVSENAEQLIGQTVTVRSEVEEMLEESAFLIEDNQFFGGSNVLVINATGQPFLLPTNYTDQVQVTGVVHQFVIADLEREYNLTLNPDVYAEYENQPVIIAQSLALAPDPGEITKNPEIFYNQVIAVQGEVENIYSPDAFSIDEEKLFGGDDLLVVSMNPSPAVNENESVVVVGVLRPYIKSEFERDYDLQWDLDLESTIEAEYAEKPVLAAQEVYPSAIK
jgi:hypothetical protein